MQITLRLVLLILALVCFLLAAVGVPAPRINLLALGLALWILAVIVGPGAP
jgi:hypothetical protein